MIERISAEYKNMFSALDFNGDGRVKIEDLRNVIVESGIELDDVRLSKAIKALTSIQEGDLDFEQFQSVIGASSAMIKNIILKRLIIPDFSDFCHDLSEIFEQSKQNHSGSVASYIPQLGRVDPEYFGMSLTTISGQRFSLGDSDQGFCLQSVNKPINYCLALTENGSEKVSKHVGREPSGQGFNELSLNSKGLPHNPMINAGAIMCCSLIRSDLSLADRFEYILGAWNRLSGNSKVSFNNPVYLSERETADRNFALGYFMREKNAFPADTDLIQTLEFYFQCCSIELDARGLSVVAASLANGGQCPVTGEMIFEPQIVQNCLSLMSSCGMYNYSGEFAFSIGLPSKSGVSGGIMVVVPNVMGLAIWSPRLDENGNSVRGIEFCRRLVEKFNFHVYDSISLGTIKKKDPRLKKNVSHIEGVVHLCWAASQGDLVEVQNIIATGVDPNWSDYDGRTALHLAASEGHVNVVEYLLSHNADMHSLDRWKSTPLCDAKRAKQKEVIELFERNVSR